MIYTCLASFPYHGAALRLYSYSSNLDVPKGIEVANAREIIPDESQTGRFISDGRVAVAKFANLFRYRMIQKTGLCWVDADILCLRRPDFERCPIILGRQAPPGDPHSINCAVIRLPRNSKILSELVERAEAAMDLDQPWGATGPQLVTELAAKHEVEADVRPINAFYPLPFKDFWMVLVPSSRAAVDQAITGSAFLHLWHQMFKLANQDSSICPPAGSFLHAAARRFGTLQRFSKNGGMGGLNAWMPESTHRQLN